MPIQSFEDLRASVLAAPPKLADVRLVCIDGRAGSGKTTFARRLIEGFGRDVSVSLLHSDDLLGGWGHPANFGPRLREWVLDPLVTGDRARYLAYDWDAERFGTDWIDLGRPDVLVIEGVATAAATWRPLASHLVFVDTDPELCLRRGIARDGEALLPEWLAWREHEDTHFAADDTIGNVDTVVAGDPEGKFDPETHFETKVDP